jgi:hypothetical protein
MSIPNIQELVDKKKLTRDGADWLRLCLDPFHDYSQNFEGFPDIISSQSRVQLYTRTSTITSPDGNPFSARVWVTPNFSHDLNHFEDVAGASLDTLNIDTATNYGPLGIVVCDSWNGASSPNSSIPGATFVRSAMKAKSDDCPGRLIAFGVEVHNTTSPLYKSGIVTCSRLPHDHAVTCIGVHDSALVSAYSKQMVNVATLPPYTSSNALLVPGATQWEAEKGAYMVAHLAKESLPISGKEYFLRSFTTGSGVGNSTLSSASLVSAGSNFVSSYYSDGEHSFDLPYMIFEGLSAETSLTVTIRSYVEYFPTHVDSAFMPFATPSPRLDVLAMKLYGATAPFLPMAVPVGMNARGEYFKMVMQALSKGTKIVAPMIAAAFPSAAPATAIAAIVADVLDKRYGKKTNGKKRIGRGTVNGQPSSSRKKN